MSPAELLKQCDEQIALAGAGTVVVLVLKGRKSRGPTARLLGRRGPVGDVYSDIGGLTVGFKASEVKAFIEREFEGKESA